MTDQNCGFVFLVLDLRKVTVSFLENRMFGGVEGAHFFMSVAACVLIQHQMPQLKLKLVHRVGNFARK